MESDLIAKRREAHNKGHLFAEGEGRLAIVVRIRGINQTSPKVRKTLQLLRLRQIHNAVFVRLNKATEEMLVQFRESTLVHQHTHSLQIRITIGNVRLPLRSLPLILWLLIRPSVLRW